MTFKFISQNNVGGLHSDHIFIASEWTFLTYTHRDAGGDKTILTTHRMLSKLFLHWMIC